MENFEMEELNNEEENDFALSCEDDAIKSESNGMSNLASGAIGFGAGTLFGLAIPKVVNWIKTKRAKAQVEQEIDEAN